MGDLGGAGLPGRADHPRDAREEQVNTIASFLLEIAVFFIKKFI